MTERVGIVAVGQTKYHPNRADVNEEELAYEAIKQVLETTGLTLSDIDSAVSCSQDFWDGRTISAMNIQSKKREGQMQACCVTSWRAQNSCHSSARDDPCMVWPGAENRTAYDAKCETLT